MDVPAERIDRLYRWFRRAAAVGIVVGIVSVAQMAGWLAAVGGWIEAPLVDEALLREQLTRPPDSVYVQGRTSTIHEVWGLEEDYAIFRAWDASERRDIAIGLRAIGFRRVYGPTDPMPDGLLADCTIERTWQHPFVVSTRQTVYWGDPVAGQSVSIKSRQLWVLFGWWPLEPDVVKERWFNRENL